MNPHERMLSSDWNNKWPKDRVTYNARASANRRKRITVDVRNYIWNTSVIIEDLLKTVTSSGDNDEKATKICRWVQDNIKYVGDEKSSGANEFWQFPAETLALRTGDCEDMSILIVSMMRVAGVDAHRIKVAAGLVKTGKNAETGGHAYPVYLRDGTNEEWVVLDPCYYPVRTHASKRPLHKNMRKYKDIWFTFNDEYSWAQKSFELTKRINASIRG